MTDSSDSTKPGSSREDYTEQQPSFASHSNPSLFAEYEKRHKLTRWPSRSRVDESRPP